MNSDERLLEMYARSRDAEAYAELSRRHLGLVYGTCLRILRNPSDAEDAAQECFLKLAGQAGKVRSSLPGWLHAQARGEALIMLRKARRRRKYEQQLEQEEQGSEARVVAADVDRALTEIPEELRVCILMRYFQSRSQAEIAKELGVDQSTISRRIDRGIEMLRSKLAKSGDTMPAAVVGLFLEQGAMVPAPATLQAAVAKLALAGVGGSAAAATIGVGVKVFIAAVLLVSAGVALVVVQMHRKAAMMATPLAETHPVDYSGIRLTGFGMREDSVSLAVRAAARALTKDADYERLYCLSGNAFAPAIDTAEGCTSWWHVKAPMGTQNLPLMAQSLGLEATPIAQIKFAATPTREQENAFVRQSVPAIRAAMASGAVVVTEGGWDEANAWDWAGVVTSVSADGEVRGATLSPATLDGHVNVPMTWARSLWAIRPAASAQTQTDLAMLKLAVARIRGSGVYEEKKGKLYGLPAMDKWIAQMRTVRGFCGECFGRKPRRGVTDSNDNDGRLYDAAKIVARQLRAIRSLPPDAKPYIDAAAGHYDRIAALLEKPVNTRGFYDTLDSLEAQQAYAASVLEPAKAAMSAACTEMELALGAAEGAVLLPKVARTFDALSLDDCDQNATRTDLRMRWIVMRAAGVDDVPYDHLVMLSGFGTSFGYHPQKFFVMYRVPDDGAVTERRLIEGTGFGWQWLPRCKSPEEAWAIIKESVDGGRPVQASWYDHFLCAGYIPAQDPAARKVFVLGKWAPPTWLTWDDLANWIKDDGRLGRPTGQKMSRQDLSSELLARSVEYARHDPRANDSSMKDASFGLAGMEKFASDVADVTRTYDAFNAGWLGCHCVNRQSGGRKFAATWLLRLAGTKGGAEAEHLRKAADLYAREYAMWEEFRILLQGSTTEERRSRWGNPVSRAQGAAIIRQALELERAAVTELDIVAFPAP